MYLGWGELVLQLFFGGIPSYTYRNPWNHVLLPRTFEPANAISCNCWERDSVCYLPHFKVMILYPPSVFIKTPFKLTPERQSKNLHSAPLGKLVVTLRLQINSWGRAGLRAETLAAICSLQNNVNNSSFPRRLPLPLPLLLLLLEIMHSSAYSTQKSISSPTEKNSTTRTLIKLCKALGTEKKCKFSVPKKWEKTNDWKESVKSYPWRLVKVTATKLLPSIALWYTPLFSFTRSVIPSQDQQLRSQSQHQDIHLRK